MKRIGIIPARYGSTRLPGKALKMIGNKPLVQRVYENAKAAIGTVFVATDSSKIYRAVDKFGGKAIMTPTKCENGSERCLHAYYKLQNRGITNAQYIINIQGDLPFVKKEHIRMVSTLLDENPKDICTIFFKTQSQFDIQSRDGAFLITDKYNNALYFSRFPIPYYKNTNITRLNTFHKKHIGIYGYHHSVLRRFVELGETNKSELEHIEKLEQLRWIEGGYNIKAGEVGIGAQSVDTQEDLELVNELLKLGLT